MSLIKRSTCVSLGLTSALALSITGCGTSRSSALEAQRCVEQNGRVVEERYCEDRRHGSFGYPFRWYYGGRGYYPGQFAYGGGYSASGAGIPIRPSSPGFSSAVRGGFGSTGAGHGSGGGE